MLFILFFGLNLCSNQVISGLLDSKFDRPTYTSLANISKNIEIREYDPGYWIETPVHGNFEYSEQSDVFFRLLNYILGKNEKQQTYDMTVPVTIGKTNGRVDSMSFFITNSMEATPPNPTKNSDVTIKRTGTTTYYVMGFSGFDLPRYVEEKYQEMISILNQNGLQESYDPNHYYTAVYDPPYKLFDRHNEIWIEKTTPN